MLNLRKANNDDLPLMMAWRSNPLVYEGFYQQTKPLQWGEHEHWFSTRNKGWRTFIIEYMERPVGVVTIGQLDHWSPEIGYYVGEVSLWNCGVGTHAVSLALDYLEKKRYEHCHTTVLETNKASLKLLEKLGFEILGKAREGELWLTRKLRQARMTG